MTREAVKHFCEREWPVHLEDVMIRRAGWHYYFADARERAEQVAAWMAEFLDWPATFQTGEVERYQAAMDRQAAAIFSS